MWRDGDGNILCIYIIYRQRESAKKKGNMKMIWVGVEIIKKFDGSC